MICDTETTPADVINIVCRQTDCYNFYLHMIRLTTRGFIREWSTESEVIDLVYRAYIVGSMVGPL